MTEPGMLTAVRRIPVAIGVCLLLAGCVDGGTPDLTPGAEPALDDGPWTYGGNGTFAWRFALAPLDHSVDCHFTTVMQGKSAGFDLIGFTRIHDGAAEIPKTWFIENEAPGLMPRIGASSPAGSVESSPAEHRDEWHFAFIDEVNVSKPLEVHLGIRDGTPVGWTPNETVGPAPGQHGLWTKLECTGPVKHNVTRGNILLLADERTLPAEGASVHVGLSGGLRLAHAAILQGLRMTAEHTFDLDGLMSGDPEKVGTMTLDAPNESKQWMFLPAPQGIIGDARFAYDGGPGAYHLSISSVNAGPLIAWRAVAIDWPDESSR